MIIPESSQIRLKDLHSCYFEGKKGIFQKRKKSPVFLSSFPITLGRLLRANQITFNWDRLASWINLTEQWPYRTSWLILHLEETEGVPDQLTLKTIYER